MNGNRKLDYSSGSLTRRDFLRGGAAAGGLLAGAGALGQIRGLGGSSHQAPLGALPFGASGNLTLTCAPARVDVGGGQFSDVWAYNGMFPGPLLEAWTGSVVRARLVNQLPEETITHWHGMIVDEANDGGPHRAIPPGGAYSYVFPVVNRACLNLYHPHPHHLTGKQVNLGLSGAFVIRDAEEAALNLPSGPYESPLIIRDANFDSAGNLLYNPQQSGFDGKYALVNGKLDATMAVDAALYRFRVLNNANARLFRLRLSSGAPFTLVGNDGGLLEYAVDVPEIEFGPGERVDVLVDFRGLPVGTRVMLRDENAGWSLIEFEVVRSYNPGFVVPPGRLSAIAPLGTPVRTRTFSFDGMGRINGRSYQMERIDFEVPFDQVERWYFTTGGNAPHPVHVHGASFQVLSRQGGRNRLYEWEQGWKDTLLLHDRETVEVLIRFDRHPHYAGAQKYVLHCHKLEHEDMGMMSNFLVVP